MGVPSTPSTGNYTFTHNLGQTPKALIMFENMCTTAEATRTDCDTWQYVTLFDGTTAAGIQAGAADYNTPTTTPDAFGQVTTGYLDITCSQTFTSWDTTQLIQGPGGCGARNPTYLIVGGTDVSAKVLQWTMPTTSGNKSVTGVGFQPDVVFHIHAGNAATALNTNRNNAVLGLGAMDGSGDQWANAVFSQKYASATNSNSSRYQRIDQALVEVDGSSVVTEASFVSMDTNGFTMNFTTAPASAGNVYSLALKGLNVKVGNFTAPTSTGNKTTTYSEFTPKAVFFTSVGTTAQTTVQNHWGFSLSATDGTNQGGMSTWETDNVSPVDTVESVSQLKTMYMQEDNDTTIDGQATVTSLNTTGGFTLNWSTAERAAEMLYLALGSLPSTAIELEAFEATRDEGGVAVRWRTGLEVDNLGFHVYREEDGRKIQITPSLIGGAALFAGAQAPLGGGRSYAWSDRGGKTGSRYWLEDIDLWGASRWHGPIEARPPAAGGWSAATSPLLVEIGREREPSQDVVTFPARRRPWPRLQDDRAQALQTQHQLAEQPAIKLSVTRPGWYHVHQRDLAATGLDRVYGGPIDPHRLRLYADGKEQPILVTGAEDGSFDAGDTVEFYGSGADTPWTGARVYWLMADTHEGKRLAVAETRPGAESASSSYLATSTLRQRTIYFAALRNGDQPNFFGTTIPGKPVNQVVETSAVVASAEEALEVSLQGVTGQAHKVAVFLGDKAVGAVEFAGNELKRHVMHLPPGSVQEGQNVIRLDPQGGEQDVTLVESIQLTYRRRYEARAGALFFEASPGSSIALTGFQDPSIRVFDVTTPDHVAEIPYSAGGPMTVPYGATMRTLLAVEEQGVLRPTKMEANAPSHWHRARFADATLVMLGPRYLLDELAPLATARKEQGWTVERVDIADLFDEYTFGQKDPRAIREFLGRVKSDDETQARAVLLVGDASFDPRNFLGLGDFDLTPTWLVDTDSMETSSDAAFVDFDRDGRPDFPIGRLPVRSPAEAAWLAEKIAGHHPAAAGSAGAPVLLIADHDPKFDFEGISARLREVIPLANPVREMYRRDLGDVGLKTAFSSALGAGPLAVHYVGHGSVEKWAGDVLTSNDALLLKNGSRLPFVVSMTCLNGFFHDVYTDSLAEALLKAQSGGALAVFASSGLIGHADGDQEILGRELLRHALTEGRSLGEATVQAKAAITNLEVLKTSMLFGDPTTVLVGEPQAASHPSGSCACILGSARSSNMPAVFLALTPLLAFLWVRARSQLRAPGR